MSGRIDADTAGARRRRRTLAVLVTLAGALLGATVGFLVGGARPTGFVSTASIVVLPLPGNAFSVASNDSLVSLQTEAQLARSDAVLDRVVASGSGPADVDTLRRRTAVSVAEGSEIVLISARADSSNVSERLADTLASSTLDRRVERATAARDEQLAVVRDSIATAKGERAGADDPTLERVLGKQLVALRSQRASLRWDPLDPGDLIGVQTAADPRWALRIGLVVGGAAAGAAVGFRAARWVGRPRVNDGRVA